MNEIINLAIVGCGQLGSRHLQALAKIDRNVNIFVVDPSECALESAKKRFSESENNGRVLHISYSRTLASLPMHISVAIVATSSNVRRAIIEGILSNSKVEFFILEKVLFQKKDDYLIIGELFDRAGSKVWVNCPRRMSQFYKQLRCKIAGSSLLAFQVSGSNWGLGCNAIHMIDCFAFLSRQTKIDFFVSQLDPGLINSKRSGFKEFTGTLFGHTSERNSISLTSYATGTVPMIIDISTEQLRCIISESTGKAWIAEKESEWQWQDVSVPLLYQSQLTHLAIQEILDTGTSVLTPYQESSILHVQLIDAFLMHIQRCIRKENCVCPIT